MAAEHNYTEKLIARYARAIGHPSRLAVLQAIARKGHVANGEQLEVPGLAPASVIQHLRDLKRVGLVTGRIFGMNSNYELDYTVISEFVKELEQFLDQLGTEEKKH